MDQSITIVVPINAKPECYEQLKTRLLALVAETRKESGNVFYLPHEATDGTSRLVIYERWKNQVALDFHMNQDYLKAFLADSEAWLSTPISGILCRPLDDVCVIPPLV